MFDENEAVSAAISIPKAHGDVGGEVLGGNEEGGGGRPRCADVLDLVLLYATVVYDGANPKDIFDFSCRWNLNSTRQPEELIGAMPP